MSLFILKIIGILSMFLDHYYFIIGGPRILNIIGRVAFPIFAFALNEGYRHTKNLKLYLIRLGIFALVIQLPLFFSSTKYPMNIFFTLFTGLLIITIMNTEKVDIFPKILIIASLFYITKKFEFDYSIYGILLIMIFNIFYNRKILIFVSFLFLNLIIVYFPEIFDLSEIQFYSIFSLIFIFLYNGKKGKSMKYFFYLFYPLHFFVIELINKFLIK